MKKENKGFVLVETLVVTVFVMAVFSVIYINFYPLAGEYERRDFYDDIDSKYGAYWMKLFIQDSGYDFYASGGYFDTVTANTYAKFSCDVLPTEKKNFCSEMWNRLDVKNVIITTYNLEDFKNHINSDPTGFSDSFVSYIEYLPIYKVASLNGARYRVLVEFERTADSDADSEIYYTYATMEVVAMKR